MKLYRLILLLVFTTVSLFNVSSNISFAFSIQNTPAPRSLKDNPLAVDDSLQILSSVEQKQRLNKILNQITLAYKKHKSKDANERIITAEFGTFKLLVIVGRAMDRAGKFGIEINEHERQFNLMDQKSSDPAKKIVNGFTAIYSMYSTLASMYAQNMKKKDSLLKVIEDIQSGVRDKMHSKISAMEIVAHASMASYRLVDLALREADTSEVLNEAFESIHSTFLEGDRVAMTDEDRFLNGVFRVFELSQLWAYAVDPYAKDDINKLQTDIVIQSRAAQQIDEQIAIALEHLYSITHIIAVGYIKKI